MSRIKGWRKISDGRGLVEWQNKKSGTLVAIGHHYNIPKNIGAKKVGWTFGVAKSGGTYKIYPKLFKTKEKALKSARAWMRKHPNG